MANKAQSPVGYRHADQCLVVEQAMNPVCLQIQAAGSRGSEKSQAAERANGQSVGKAWEKFVRYTTTTAGILHVLQSSTAPCLHCDEYARIELKQIDTYRTNA